MPIKDMQTTFSTLLSTLSSNFKILNLRRRSAKDVRFHIARRCILLLSGQQYEQVSALLSHELSLLLRQDGLQQLWKKRFKLYGELIEIRKLHSKQLDQDVQIDYRCLFSRGRAVFRIRLDKDASISDMFWFDGP